MRLVAVAHAPLLYGPQEGLGQLLHKPASPGALGAAADWFRVIAGLLPSAFVGMACRLPPAAALVQQAAVVNGTTLAEASAVSPLLCFRDVAHEAAAVACMQRRYAHNDWKLFAQGSTCLFFLFLRVQQAGHWAPGVLAECVMLLALLLLSLRYHETFIRWRSVLISAVYLIHSLVTRTTTPMVFGPSCPHVATFFLREFNISQAFWLALICTAHPVPLKHAVWSQGAAVASMLAYLPQLRANAIVRCAASEQHYLQAARALTVVASSVFPSPLGSQVLKLPQQLGPTVGWIACCCTVLLCFKVTDLVR
ncbi:hypothetical protein C2E21_6949 [Chlorella sorokiniana]|uniref:Uncharacterized protein n=1 Tax=Chlorella sorokiniana TaxID=3076 RepID=A0A2P6TJ31_CHLSO|nr:hypothetical protein C2E21_6949 [Chlorella sorokiniana]|eukprot:PRW39222.1 hypothetical protein C2E21_6949 [Chlorella sorokiniana]